MYPKNIAVIYNIIGEITQNLEREREMDIIASALTSEFYQVTKIGINSDIRSFINTLTRTNPDYIFNMCEDVDNNNWGEIYVAGLLELLHIPYTGSRPLCLGICLDKGKSKNILDSYQLPTPKHQLFKAIADKLDPELNFPFIVKPLYEDGSYGIEAESVVNTEFDLRQRLEIIFNVYGQPALVEEYIDGRELNVSLIGNGEDVRALPFSEIDYSRFPKKLPKICSYSAKWKRETAEYKGAVPICPASVAEPLRKNLERISRVVYKVFGCRDYARVDFRLAKNNQPYVIDVNPNPCIAPDSGFARSGKAAGMDYKTLIREILNACRRRTDGNYNDGQTRDHNIAIAV